MQRAGFPRCPISRAGTATATSRSRTCCSPVRGVCLLDLDTLGLSTMAFEIGDAMRSWCNPYKEDAGRVAFDLATFAAAIRGFRTVADPIISDAEKIAIV